MLGDAVIVWPDLFLGGVALFGIAHVYYTKAFGLNDLNFKAGVALLAVTVFCKFLTIVLVFLCVS